MGTKKTIKELSEEYGISESTIKRYKNEGIDIQDQEAVMNHQAVQGYCGANDTPITEDATELKLRKLLAETLKKEREAEKLDLELKVKRGELISVNEVAENLTAIASKTQAHLRSLIISLGPKIAGLDERQIKKVLEVEIDAILEQLFTDFNIEDEP